MSGTRTGGLKVAEYLKQTRGEDYYRKIGHSGGKISRGGGFASQSPEMRRYYGSLGGRKSKRGKAKVV